MVVTTKYTQQIGFSQSMRTIVYFYDGQGLRLGTYLSVEQRGSKGRLCHLECDHFGSCGLAGRAALIDELTECNMRRPRHHRSTTVWSRTASGERCYPSELGSHRHYTQDRGYGNLTVSTNSKTLLMWHPISPRRLYVRFHRWEYPSLYAGRPSPPDRG
jgi:hypothetical protein